MAKLITAREFLSSRQDAATDFAESRGVDRWTGLNYDLKRQADDFGNYLNSGNYTTADTDRYRSSANKAVEDLTAEMSRYGKSSDRYKQLDSYRQFYQNSLGTFDRLDVGTKMGDYINDKKTWRSQEDYNLQKQSLQDSLAALDAEMEKIEDKESADYKSLQSWRDWYASYEDALNKRADWDKRFTDADDFAAYDNSANYQHVADVRRTIKEKQDELKAIDPSLENATAQDIDQRIQALQSQMNDLQLYGSPADVQNAQMQLTALQQAKETIGNLDAMRTELGRLEQYGGENILRNYGGAYDPNFNYEAKLDELQAALSKAEEGSDKYEEISAQIRALAGPNGDGTNANGLYDENTWYGRYVMDHFDLEAAQKRIDEIDKELEDLGLPKDRWLGQFIAGGQLSEGEVGYNPDGTVEVGAESDPHVMELRREKTELTQKMNSSERQQGRSKIETANAELPEVDGAYGKGNIDLTKRNTGLKDADGNLMTVKSMSFEEDGKEILIPTVVKKNGKWVELSDDEAIDWYHKTGEYLGKFDSVEEADKYAEALHRQQEDMYVNGKTKTGVSKSTLIEAGKGQLDNTKAFYSGPNGVKNIGRAFAELEGEFGDTDTDKYYAARAQELLDIVYAAMGAEKLGIDIGYSVEEALDAYEAQINDIAGYRRAAEVNRIDGDFWRWNAQMFGRGGLVGGAFSNIQNLPGLFTDEYRPASATQSQIAHTGEMMGDQYDKLVLPGGKNLAQTIHEAAVTTGNMLPGMALSAAVTALAGPAGLSTTGAALAGKIAGAFEMGLTSGGQSYQQMLGMGYDAADARAYGAAMGAAEVGTQYLLGGIGKLGGVTEDMVLNLTKRIGNGILRAAAETAIHDVSEISEELLQNRIEGYLQHSLFDQGNAPKFFEMTEDDWYTVVVTALSTTAMEGPGVAINSYRNNQLGLLASGKKSYSEAKTKGLMSAKLNKQEKARRALASEIGKAMQSDEALSYTLKTIGSSMDEGTNARELADLMEDGKIPANARNLGELFGAILSETTTEDGKHLDFDKFMAKTIGGAIKFNEIKRAEQAEGDTEKALNDAGQTLEEVMKNNPGAAVLNKTASALSTQYGADPVKAVETAAVINKIRNGTAISSREMEQITGNTAEAKAARAYLAKQAGGENISVTADAAVTEAMVNELIKTNREQKKLIAEQTKAEVLAAATEAGDAAVVNRAAAGAVTKITAEDVKALQGAKRGVQEAERAAEIAKTRKQTVNDMSFEQMSERAEAARKAAQLLDEGVDPEKLPETLERALLTPADAKMVEDLRSQNAELQKTIDELSAVKMPSRAQASQLASARQQLAENKARVDSILKSAAEDLKKRSAEIEKAEAESKKAEEKTEEKPKKKGKKGIPPKQKKGEETVTLPSGNTMTRSEFNGTDEEWNNMVAQSGGSVTEESNEQTTDNDQGRNALGGQRDGGADQERGDQSEQGSDAGGDRSRRKLSTFDGSREVEINEEVDSDATITHNDDVSGLEESHPGIREFTDSLMSAGFKRITYVTNGNLYNIEGEAVPGFYNNGELFLSLDPRPGWAGYEATAEHEKLHLKLDFFRQRFGAEEADNFISSSLQNILGEASYIDAFRKYWKRYSPVYLRNNDIQTVAHMVNEEMLCDMIGGIDNFDANLGFYQDSLQDILDASNFNSVADALANRPDENPGTVTTEALDPGAMPHNVPVDTLISGENVDTPSTLPADPGNVSKLAFYGLASALGFKVDETHPKSKVYYLNDEDARLGRNGFTQITVDMIKASPIGNMIRYAQDKGYITEDQAEQEYNLFASIGSISDQTHDFYQAMQFMGSTIFTALKMNSDPQYGTTYDFPSICTKTQAVIDDMSAQMVSLKRALTEDEIIEIYQRQFTAGNPVPCPECYVFSRWVGIGGLLDNINYYQDTYGSMTPEEVARIYEENAEKVAKAAEAAGVNFGKQKSKMAAELQKKYNDLKEKREKAESVGKAVSKKAFADEEALRRQMSDIRSLSWIDNVYFGGKAHLAKNVNKNFRVPTEILFDLNEGETFARDYKEAWAFRTTQGAGYGKAITPYAEAILGEGIQITKGNGAIKLKADGKLDHVFLSETGEITDKSERGKTLKAATKKQLNQLFIGGQRFQSTSDARFDNAVDYLLAGLEMQTMHGGVQVYTKVPGAVHFFNLLGMCTNMSLMPKGSGLDENGVPVDTTTGGMNPETAMMLRLGNEYAGTITIGVNDAHIRAMFNQVFRDFIIPYHASGGKAALISEFRRIQEGRAVGEGEMPQSTDYTNTQTDKFVTDEILRNDLGYTEAEIEDVRKFRATRIYILTNGSKRVKNNTFYREMLDTSAEGLTESQINARRILQQLYVSMREGGDWHGVELSKGLIEGQIFPNEFWDTSVSYEESGVNTQRYLDYCKALGVLHRFSGKGVKTGNVTNKDGTVTRRGYVYNVTGRDQHGNEVALTDLAYKNGKDGEIEPFFWKTLTDRRMYGNQGQYLKQPRVDLTNLKAEDVVTFAAPMGERRYNRRDALRVAAQPLQSSQSRMSLQNLDYAVEPSTDKWQRDHTTEEVKAMYPDLWDITADESETRNPTQVRDTVKTYRKIYDILKAENFNGKILDASSGLGDGTRAGREEYGFDVEDIEPFPDKTYSPKYTDYDSLNEKYDAIISNAVLNVLPQDQRDALVVKMGELLNPGGKMYINVRGDDVRGNKSNQPIGGKWEYYVASTGSYQKGFTKPELKAYLEDALGDGFTVRISNDFGKTAAIVTKDSGKPSAVKPVIPAKNAPKKQTAKAEKPATEPRYSIQGNDASVDSLYPEGTLQRDILDILRTEGSEGLTAWVNEQKAKHEDALENAKIKAPSIPSKGFVPPVSAKERALQRSTLEALINRYGTMKPSEKSNGFVLPPKNQKGQPLRRHIQNVLSSENISDEARDHGLRFTLTNFNATYVQDSNKDLLENAVSEIEDMGPEHALATFKHNASKVNLGTKGILQTIALGEQLLLETSSNGDMANFIDVLSSVCELGTTIGKSLQAFRLLKQSGPIGQLYYVQKAVDRMNKQNEERMKRGKFKELVVKDDLAKAVINAKTEEDRDAAMKALIADIASQTPATFFDRWNAWRYLSMLGNARTHVRNIVGNAFFAPLRYVKDVMAAGGEYLATKAGWMEEEDRTKALSVSRELRDFAAEDAEIMRQELQGNGKYNPTQEILKARRLLPGFLDALSRKNGDLLELEDWWFLKGAYARALAMQLSHMGYTTEQLTTTTEGQEALNRARKTAILEAQKATYRDFVAAASWLNRGKHLTGAAGTMLSIGLEGVLPFTKTPINILRRGVEYSPLGIAKGIGTVLSGLKNGNLDVAEAIDQLAAGLTGTGVAVLGLLLARMGVLRGKKGDDDEENFDKMQGMQDYSLQIGDQSFTIDWAAPSALPLFTGAAVNELLEESDGELGLKDIWNGIMMIAEPMTSLSMLDGLNKLIESTAYASGNEKIAVIANQAATSYLGQAFPTILGQVARSIDGTRRSTYVDKNSPIPAAGQRFIQTSVQGKIPGWENAKVPYIDAWGRQSEPSSKVLNGIENFFAPWYRNTKQVTDVDEELRRLNDEVGEVLPKTPEKSFKVDGQQKNLTPDEWVSFATDVGQTKYDLMTQMISDPRYLALTDAQKAKVIKEYVYKYSLAAGKFHIAPEYDIRKNGAVWIQEAEAAATDYARFERIWEAIEKGLKL